MKVVLQIELQVDPDEEGQSFTPQELQETAKEAIAEALNHGENRGFYHPLAHAVSVGVAEVSIVEVLEVTGEIVDETQYVIIAENQRFLMASEADPNDCDELDSRTWEDAYREALGRLQWNIYLGDKD